MRQHAPSTKMSSHVISFQWFKGKLTENQERSFMEKPMGFLRFSQANPSHVYAQLGVRMKQLFTNILETPALSLNGGRRDHSNADNGQHSSKPGS